jgi:ubiquinone/menaquinone biosynthesis C-methylase UbiE
MPLDTSWGGVADWYASHLEEAGTYHADLVLPNLIRLVEPKGRKILDLAGGEGFVARGLAAGGAEVTLSDISPELIASAQKHPDKRNLRFEVASSDKLTFAEDSSFDVVTLVLAIQNIENTSGTFAECARILRKNGSFIIVLNHPAFRIPGRTSWEFDEKRNVQTRCVDAYMSDHRSEIKMHPGSEVAKTTQSFHRPLQTYSKQLEKNGFCIKRIEEWTSHKKSEVGPRQVAENRARKEIPLFMMIEAIRHA